MATSTAPNETALRTKANVYDPRASTTPASAGPTTRPRFYWAIDREMARQQLVLGDEVGEDGLVGGEAEGGHAAHPQGRSAVRLAGRDVPGGGQDRQERRRSRSRPGW